MLRDKYESRVGASGKFPVTIGGDITLGSGCRM